jgi:NAD(P)H-hydrate repair Nnr-like enzyme with NAD(P)H-hydrate dehydratase domain
MGDVLTGIVGGFLAQGYNPDDACILSVFAHGLAGDLVARRKGGIGIIAGDIADAMPEALQEILEGKDEEFFYRIR